MGREHVPNIVRLYDVKFQGEPRTFRVEFDADIFFWHEGDKAWHRIDKGVGYYITANDELEAYNTVNKLITNGKISTDKDEEKRNVLHKLKRHEKASRKPRNIRG